MDGDMLRSQKEEEVREERGRQWLHPFDSGQGFVGGRGGSVREVRGVEGLLKEVVAAAWSRIPHASHAYRL